MNEIDGHQAVVCFLSLGYGIRLEYLMVASGIMRLHHLLIYSSIKRANNSPSTAIQNMGINHGGFDIFVTQQLLDGADVVAILQKFGYLRSKAKGR